MENEPRELTNEEGARLGEFLDLVFGAGMIVAGLAMIVMMICAKASWGAYLAGAILFLFCLMVGGMMMKDAWENLKKRRQRG